MRPPWPSCNLGLEPLSANAADAYCYHVALGRKTGARALQSMALPGDECDKFESRIEFSRNHLQKLLKPNVKAFEVASLEAYLRTPMMLRRPKLVRLSKAKHAEGSTAAFAMDMDPVVERESTSEPASGPKTQQAAGMDVEPTSEPAAEGETQQAAGDDGRARQGQT